MFQKLSAHMARVRRELGQSLRLGNRQFRVRGYLPNRLTTSSRHEPYLLAPLGRAFATKSGAVIDIGVNTGQTLLKILSLDPQRRYIGIEPQVGCAFFVDQFIRDNKLNNAEIVCLAVGNRNAMMALHAQGQYDEMASLHAASRDRYSTDTLTRYVPVRIGDEVLEEIGTGEIAVLKIDVEGAELEVLRGLIKTVRTQRPICFFEVLANFAGHERTMINTEVADSNRARAAELMQFFVEADYEVRQIDAQGNEHVIDVFDLDRPTKYVGADYVAYPCGRDVEAEALI